MPNTPNQSFPYPAPTDTPDVPYWSQRLAEAVEVPLFDTGWQTLTLASGWTTIASHTPRYRRIGNRVQISGMAQCTTLPITNTIVTLPAAIWPSVNNAWLGFCILTTSRGMVQVMVNATNGIVSVPSTSYVSGTPVTNDSLSITGTYLLG